LNITEFYPFVEYYRAREDGRGPLFDPGAAVAGVAEAAGTVVAANTEADAAKYAANLQSQAATNSLAFTKQQYATQQQQQAPYVAAGQGAIKSLASQTAPGGALNTPYSKTFNAPAPFSFTAADFQQDPAYQFNLAQGQQAIQRSAAAQGGVLSAGTQKALAGYTQGMAGNEWQNAYGNAFNTYQANYANSLQNYNTAYNVWSNNQSTSFNRQAAIAGIGQTANQQLGSAGAQAASNVSQTAAAGAAGAGNYLTQGASAIGAGTMGVTNALTGASNAQFNAMNSSSYGGGYNANNAMFGGGLTSNVNNAPVSQAQWNAYDATSTPAGYEDAY
jgi:hypothetical protein